MLNATTGDPIAEQVTRLSDASYRSIPKIVVDILLWLGAGYLIYISSNWMAVLALAFFIGSAPLHDLLVQGHEGSHGLIPVFAGSMSFSDG